MESAAELPYCASPYAYARRRTRAVMIGPIGVGGDHPIRVQSMTTPATTDVEATVAQIVRLIRAGCEIVRVTVPSSADAAALPAIRQGMSREGVQAPLVADIHFSPQAALLAVPHVEKVRINPGNYADKKRFKVWEYTDQEYQEELERLDKKVAPLVRACLERGVAMRIGTNHGSLSDRILNRYGDTPLGMVESALEFVRICRRYDFHQIVLSMKASHPMVAIQAYRLLAARMDAEGMDYPFHLGVTEAGDGEDGRVKSAIGIGALLDDGLGDTVRVSLTEDPVAEIPVALALVQPYNALSRAASLAVAGAAETTPSGPRSPYVYRRRAAAPLATGGVTCGGDEPVRVEALAGAPPADEAARSHLIEALAGPQVTPETRCEVLEVVVSNPNQVEAFKALVASASSLDPALAMSVRATAAFLQHETRDEFTRLLQAAKRVSFRVRAGLDEDGLLKRSIGLDLARTAGKAMCWVLAPGRPQESAGAAASLAVDLVDRTRRAGLNDVAVAVEPGFAGSQAHVYRRVAASLDAARLRVPLILVDWFTPGDPHASLRPAAGLGSLLCDGIGDAVRLESRDGAGQRADAAPHLHAAREMAFTLLQGTRIRIVKTEFISCPSCGRTQFDLEETTRRIKERTGHLKGLKIAIMGCIVNGPGEMADADFGYVGWGPGKIALFVGKDMVARDVPTADADQRLVSLIREHGRWVDPPGTSD